MPEHLLVPFPASIITAAVEVHLNRTFFKRPHHVTSMTQDGDTFVVRCELITQEPITPKPRKPRESKRGLNPKVLGAQQQENGTTDTRESISE